MFVPAGAFGGVSPERRASELMNAMLTYVSAWIVISQLENVAPRRSVAGEDAGEDGEGEARRVTTSHEFLLDYLEANPVRDGEQWLIALTRVNPTLAERIMAVRRAYAEEDFEWHNVAKLTSESIAAGNERAMREWLKSAVPQSARDAVTHRREACVFLYFSRQRSVRPRDGLLFYSFVRIRPRPREDDIHLYKQSTIVNVSL